MEKRRGEGEDWFCLAREAGFDFRRGFDRDFDRSSGRGFGCGSGCGILICHQRSP